MESVVLFAFLLAANALNNSIVEQQCRSGGERGGAPLMLALSLKEKKQEEKQQNRRQQATAFALNKSSNKTVDKAPADRTYIAVVCAPSPSSSTPLVACVSGCVRACSVCLSGSLRV